MSILDSMRAWLPYPEYEFRGGPVDGKRLVVTLVETGRGMVPLNLWNVQIPDQPIIPFVTKSGTVPNRSTFRVHTYRFVPVGYFNEGYYQYIEPRKV